VGIGAVIPHVESTIGGAHFEQYQWHGPGVQSMLGTNFDLTRHWSIFTEYKLSYADLDLSIPGGSIQPRSMDSPFCEWSFFSVLKLPVPGEAHLN